MSNNKDVNTKDFASELKNKLDLDDTKIESMLNGVVSVLRDKLLAGNSIAIQGFGTFEVRKKEERISVNPSTKKRMLVPPKLSVAFKPSVVMKEQFNKMEKK
ncbi:MAG TPA: HU family DNA-binding protein [Paludibacteraceae bacterium]|nr:HU family DNA-binding protein [Paludibacteraceae bacterium]HPH62865.1 HU family DNA-binding protein [Paludibacteraceae bacterium]